MHMHKYEKIWLVIGIASLVAFLAILAYGAFWKGTHPQSAMETLDPENVQAIEHLQEDNLGLTKVYDKQYVLIVVASSFNFYLVSDEDGYSVQKVRIPKGSSVLFQISSTDVVHGFNVAGTNANMMVEPGHISRDEVKLNSPGTYTIVCNEYCGIGHHQMFAELEVYE